MSLFDFIQVWLQLWTKMKFRVHYQDLAEQRLFLFRLVVNTDHVHIIVKAVHFRELGILLQRNEWVARTPQSQQEVKVLVLL